MNGLKNQTDPANPESLLPCAKCSHENPRRANVCEKCGAHLYVTCHKCGHRAARSLSRCSECGHNLYVTCHNCGHRAVRSLSRCSECGHRLHRSWGRRLYRATFGKYRKVTLLQIILLIIGILLGIGAVVYFANISIPEQTEGTYAPIFSTELTRHA